GFLTGSLGILAEAAHSALDLVAAAMTLFAVRISDKPADGHHLYGHGKVENLSALFDQDLSVGKKRMFPSAGLAEIIVPEALVQRKKSSVSSR
ncbi:MAG: cation transporter, partial [bacterium]